MQPNKLAVQDLFKPEAVTNELSEYWVTIISKRWLILILTVAAFIGSYLYYQHLPTLYTAQVDILVENTAEMPKTAQGNMTVSNPDAQMEDYYGTQIVILKGRRSSSLVRSCSRACNYGVKEARQYLKPTANLLLVPMQALK
jgi:hypothetical protein